jgi:catecholate siderophore receptor
MTVRGVRETQPLSVRLMVAAALAGATVTAPVLAQADAVTARPAQWDFNIPAESLAAAIAQFGRQSSARITARADLVKDLSTPGVQGRMTAAQALQRLLAGTGLTYNVASSGAFVLQQAAAPGAVRLGTVHVQGQDAAAPGADPYADPDAPYKADRLSSNKFTEPVLDTPRTVTVLTQQALEDKNATTLREIARSTAGVTLGSGEGGNAFGDRFFIRGFDARNDVFVDGVRDSGVSIRENFDDEQVEILRGPASSFAGRGTTGGAINIVTKEAQDTDFYRLEGEGGFNDATRRGTVDINKTISPVLDARFNGMIQYADIAGRDEATDNRWGVAGAVAYHPTDTFQLTANYSHTYLWGLPDFGVPYDQVTQRPVTEGIVPRDTYYGAVNRDFTRSEQDVGTVDAQWRLDQRVTLENKLRVSRSLLNYIGTIAENPSANGATAPYSSTATFFSGYVQLNAQSRYEPVNVINDQPQATFRFDTGPVRQTVITGAEFSNERISIQGYSGLTSELTTGPVAFASSGAPIVSVYDPPNYIYGSGSIRLAGNPLRYRVGTNAGYLMDTANYREFVILNAGVRYDGYHITAANNTSSRSADDGLTSYNIGLVVKPLKIASVYAAYATAADPVGDELDATSSSYGGLSATQNATQIFGAQKSSSAEVGTKWDLFDQRLLASAAAFQTDVTNARETAPAGLPGYTGGQIVAGAAYRVRGVDFELAGNVTDKWSMMGGLVLMDPKVTRSIVPTNVGLQLANIAPQSFNLLTKYQVTPWLEFGGQTVYRSEMKGGSLLAANGNVPYPGAPRPTILPGYWRFDVFAEGRIYAHTSLKLDVQNLFDRTYYDALYQSAQPFIQVAPGRAVYLDVVAKF